MTKSFLVYGTLRPGDGNYNHFLAGDTIFEENVQLEGFTMYAGSGYPYLAYGNNTVTATFVTVSDEKYEDVLRRLDMLEGFTSFDSNTNHYDRKLHTFILNGEEKQAWIYLASSWVHNDIRDTFPVLQSGDWIKHINDKYFV